jgi:hypothetical protein
MQVIEAQRASILEPHDHLHINQIRTFTQREPLRKIRSACSRWAITKSGQLRECVGSGGLVTLVLTGDAIPSR